MTALFKPCPVKGCLKRAPSLPMCANHWPLVPESARDHIHDLLQTLDRNPACPQCSSHYRHAARKATRFVNGLLRREATP